ncbi:unnamed protein product [Callosobruchus maculatus]|uniref:Protein phosphatase methylesterase 1 n=1 Tax=Callosobruchus maculatus TaxID=64391 RepID=A0A653C5T1_CALMS|nr:unnamed protein product [Callosobruchus maculatus]
MSDLRKTVLGLHAKRSSTSNSRLAASKQNFGPVKWSNYFDKEEIIETSKGKFNVYSKGSEGPILLCLHGGGYSGLTWALFTDAVAKTIHCQVKALDLRGHGKTSTNDDLDLSLETMANDVIDVSKKILDGSSTPIILLGHSMGGAVAVEVAHSIDNTVGLCVIDVVEGTALDALSSMQSILRGRPTHFRSIPHAIQWCYKSGQTHNLEAAKVSMPGQIINVNSLKLAADECDEVEVEKEDGLDVLGRRSVASSACTLTEVAEEPEEKDGNVQTSEEPQCNDCGKPPLPKSQRTENSTTSPEQGQMGPPQHAPPIHQTASDTSPPQYKWRIDLSKTEKFWTGWFTDLSHKFLEVKVPKLLLLANIHGLDTTLTVGQMQGKFQLQVLQKSGHAIHEDQPHNVAELLSAYLVKQKIALPKDGFSHNNVPSC